MPVARLRDALGDQLCIALDDATVVEAAGGVLRLVEGETTNLKITTRDDLAVAEAILARRTEA